ncbi:GPO family capsid scaffolding protein, partial [Salmonella enterica]|nr:GPO family capsid scaffolding protein [Salmonella enterica]
LQRFKASPENVFSVATLAELEFEDVPDTVLNSLADKVKAIFSRKQVSDDARMNDVHEAVTAVTEHVQTNLTAQDKRLSDMETAFATFKQELTGKVEETSQAFSDLKTTLDKTESFSQPRRTKASGGGGDELLTDC